MGPGQNRILARARALGVRTFKTYTQGDQVFDYGGSITHFTGVIPPLPEPDAADFDNLLGLIGNQVRVAHDGPAGIAAARGFRPDVVLLDIGLPGMNGYEVARLLRRQAGLTGALLLALTGYGEKEDRRRSEEAGINFHLVKPFEPEQLQRLLASWNPPAARP